MNEAALLVTPAQIVAIAGGFSAVCVAVGWVINIVKAAKAPREDLEKRVAALEALRDDYSRFFDNDKKRLDAIESGNAVTQRAILALLRHSLDGNDVEALKSAELELQDYLIRRS